MEFPLNENNQYPMIKNCVEKMFASRVKPLSEKIMDIWVSEVISRNFPKEPIEQATTEFIESEEYNLSLPIYLKLIKSKIKYVEHRTECLYCGGSGTIGLTIPFTLNGRLIHTQPYLLNCYCNNNRKLIQMVADEDTQNKTYAKDMYFRVFKTVIERDNYYKKVIKNGCKDLLQ